MNQGFCFCECFVIDEHSRKVRLCGEPFSYLLDFGSGIGKAETNTHEKTAPLFSEAASLLCKNYFSSAKYLMVRTI